MANQEQLDLLKQDVLQWNEWRKQHPETRPDLRDADLSGLKLHNADLSFSDLSFANLSLASLVGAYFTNAYLHRANLNDAYLLSATLSGANLSNTLLSFADLEIADLTNTILTHANLSFANLSDVKLSGAELRGAALHSTILARLDLRQVKGLAEIEHRGPSHIELYSVQLPQDGSALHFLRGAGAPDEWIDFWRSTMMHPVQYHSCFISYSSKDDALARRLHADLQASGVRCWFAQEDLKIGDQFRIRIDEAIHIHEKLLLLLSEDSIESSWVEYEVKRALKKEQEQERSVLFPIKLDDTISNVPYQWAADIRKTRHIGDFRAWTDPASYQVAFERLLRDLKQDAD